MAACSNVVHQAFLENRTNERNKQNQDDVFYIPVKFHANRISLERAIILESLILVLIRHNYQYCISTSLMLYRASSFLLEPLVPYNIIQHPHCKKCNFRSFRMDCTYRLIYLFFCFFPTRSGILISKLLPLGITRANPLSFDRSLQRNRLYFE